MSWIGTSPSPGRSARSRTARIAYSPRAEILIASADAAPLEQARGLAGEVRDHDVGPRPADRDERLHHRALLVEPAQAAGRADHRVLAGDRVRRERHAELG